MKSDNTEFRPTAASAPGKTIGHILAERHLSRTTFAERMGLPLSDIDQLLTGNYEIDNVAAEQLETILGSTRAFWLSRERKYRKTLERLTAEKEWLKEVPWRDMIEYEWIETAERPREILENCLKFFGVADVDEWSRQYAGFGQSVAYKTTST